MEWIKTEGMSQMRDTLGEVVSVLGQLAVPRKQ
jgi:hypothetical protein